MKRLTFLLIIGLMISSGCENTKNKKLPILGNPDIVNGERVPHSIPYWEFTNTDGKLVTNEDLSDYIYVSDFFFRSCPTICPKVKRQMKILYDEFKNESSVKFISFTIDPKRDTPEKLKEYAANLNVDTNKWWFLSGDADMTYELAEEYLQISYIDEDAPGGFDHSGYMILTDKKGHIRSLSLGTEPDETPGMIRDIKTLLTEYETD